MKIVVLLLKSQTEHCHPTADMDSQELLSLARASEDDKSWLSPGWLTGSGLSGSARADLVDWLIQVQAYLGLSDTCLHSAVASLDTALSRVHWEHTEVQLLGLTALQLAAKMEEDTPPATDLFLAMMGGVFTKADMARTEVGLLKAVDWRLGQTTAVVFLHFYAELLGRGGRSLCRLARALLDLALTAEWYGTVPPSRLAAGCLAGAVRLLGRGGWTSQLAELTACPSPDKLADITRRCEQLLYRAENDGIAGKHWKALASVNCSEPVNSTAALKSGDVNASAASARIEAKSG